MRGSVSPALQRPHLCRAPGGGEGSRVGWVFTEVPSLRSPPSLAGSVPAFSPPACPPPPQQLGPVKARTRSFAPCWKEGRVKHLIHNSLPSQRPGGPPLYFLQQIKGLGMRWGGRGPQFVGPASYRLHPTGWVEKSGQATLGCPAPFQEYLPRDRRFYLRYLLNPFGNQGKG